MHKLKPPRPRYSTWERESQRTGSPLLLLHDECLVPIIAIGPNGLRILTEKSECVNYRTPAAAAKPGKPDCSAHSVPVGSTSTQGRASPNGVPSVATFDSSGFRRIIRRRGRLNPTACVALATQQLGQVHHGCKLSALGSKNGLRGQNGAGCAGCMASDGTCPVTLR